MNELTLNTAFKINAYDVYDRIKPSAVFDEFQNAASLHADKLGVGFDDLIKKKAVWMLIRCRYDVISYPSFEQPLNITTYPLRPKGIEFDREYEITDKSGNKLIKGSSMWCICNLETRKLMFGNEFNYNSEEYSDKRQYEGTLKKIPPIMTDGYKSFRSRTYFTDLDHNGHVNNTRYLDFIMNALSEEGDFCVDYFEINYINEMKRDSEFEILYGKTENGYSLRCESGEKEIFRAVVGVKNNV